MYVSDAMYRIERADAHLTAAFALLAGTAPWLRVADTLSAITRAQDLIETARQDQIRADEESAHAIARAHHG
jgi:hypothetical protein